MTVAVVTIGKTIQPEPGTSSMHATWLLPINPSSLPNS
jgi:hypothetical protein